MEGGKVISVGGGGGGLVVGIIGDIKVEKDWGDHRSLGGTKVDCGSETESVYRSIWLCYLECKRMRPSDNVVGEGGLGDLVEKFVVWDTVKGFREVDGNSSGTGAGGGAALVETCYGIG